VLVRREDSIVSIICIPENYGVFITLPYPTPIKGAVGGRPKR
jgi:hypothetical protein